MKCPTCSCEMIWGGDHDYSDYGVSGDGIVTNFSCPTPSTECKVDTAIIYTDI